jgi:superfamily I DNA/RNA helicase
LLIVAGAGTGKTNTLAHRVTHLIGRGVSPGRILLLTFTRRAAAEMLRRVESLLASPTPPHPILPHFPKSGAARSTPSPTGCCGSTANRWGWARPSPCWTAPTPRT